MDTAFVADLAIVIVYPNISTINPPQGIITWQDKQIAIAFSQFMNPASFSDASVLINSNYSNSVIAEYSLTDSAQTLIIDLSSSFASLDTIAITLKGDVVSNYYGYLLDGDGNEEISAK